MKSSGQFAAEIITQGCQGLAALTAERLLSANPQIAARYQPNAAIKWRESIASRLHYLAAAVSIDRPELFVNQVAWAKIATISRGGGVALDDLHAGLHALSQTIVAELPPTASGPILPCLEHAMQALRTAPREAPSTLSVHTPQGRLAASYLLALLEGDRRRACAVVMDEVVARRLSVREAYLDVLQPVQQELGRMWHMNESSVAEEHFATATTQMVISQLNPHLSRRAPNGRTVVASSVESNAHEIGLRMIADFLEMDGWRAVYLGPSVPPEDLAIAVADFGADLLALSAAIAPQLSVVERTVQVVRAGPSGLPHAANARVKILVGGAAFLGLGPDDTAQQVAARLGADGYAASVDDAVRIAASLCGV